jgi:hypothetical protein
MDVFVAYSNKDEPRVRTIVEWLRLQGIEVWVAYERPAGLDWDKEIDTVLAAIPCVLVVWSPDSVNSPEVKGEARAAMARNALVTVSLDRELPPRSFTHLHAIDLSGLTVDEKSPRTAQVLEGIRSKLSPRANAADSSERESVDQTRADSPRRETGGALATRPRRARLWVGVTGLMLVAIAGAVMFSHQGYTQRSCDEDGVYKLTAQTFATDTPIKAEVVCVAAGARVRVTNGAVLDIATDTLILEGAARFDGSGAPGAPGRPGSDGPTHVHKPPRVAIAICGQAPPRSDYSGRPGGRGGNGGPGATIVIRYAHLQGDLAQVEHDVSGGAGGKGGAGGRAGSAQCRDINAYQVIGAPGSPGPDGSPGKAGRFELVKVES